MYYGLGRRKASARTLAPFELSAHQPLCFENRRTYGVTTESVRHQMSSQYGQLKVQDRDGKYFEFF